MPYCNRMVVESDKAVDLVDAYGINRFEVHETSSFFPKATVALL